MIRWEQKQTGFTIVELLIVVVVIAILAAITIVSFNGIQQQAENTKTINGVSQYGRIIQSYAAKNGSYPIAGYACLGSITTRCANTTDGLASCFGHGGASARTEFDSAIKTIVNTMPELSDQRMDCGGKKFAGGWYHSTTGLTATLRYYMKGDQRCETLGGMLLVSKELLEGVTMCNMNFAAL